MVDIGQYGMPNKCFEGRPGLTFVLMHIVCCRREDKRDVPESVEGFTSYPVCHPWYPSISTNAPFYRISSLSTLYTTATGHVLNSRGRMFGSGAARLRSLASRKPTFLTSRKGSGAKGARMSRKESGKRAAAKTEQSDSEAGDLETRSASERCKVS